MKRARQVILISVVLLAGCQGFAPIGDTTYDPYPSNSPVAVFVAETVSPTVRSGIGDHLFVDELPESAVKIGHGSATVITTASAVVALKSMARKHGADGMVVTDTNGFHMIATFYRLLD